MRLWCAKVHDPAAPCNSKQATVQNCRGDNSLAFVSNAGARNQLVVEADSVMPGDTFFAWSTAQILNE